MSGQLHGILHPNAITPLMWLPEALNRIINKTFTNGVEQGFFCLHNFDFILVSSKVHWYMYLHSWFHLSYMYTCSVIFAWIVGIMTNLLFQANMLPTCHALQSCYCLPFTCTFSSLAFFRFYMLWASWHYSFFSRYIRILILFSCWRLNILIET